MRALFVSKEHTRQTRLRFHKAYHGVVYIVLAVFVIQVPFWLCMAREKESASRLGTREKAAQAERARLVDLAAPLKRMEERIEEARGWCSTLSDSISVSEVLSRLENTVPEGICLTEVTIRSAALGPRDPDWWTIEVSAISRSPGEETWQREVERSFPGWSVLSNRGGGSGADPTAGELFPVGLLLKQPDYRTKGKALK